MDAFFMGYLSSAGVPVLFMTIAALIYFLGKGADLLVNEAITLSARLKIPRVLIGLTIVSVGTTLPEVSVSVFAAMGGNPEIALGNAVGSIICDTGLILGLITLCSPISLKSNWIKMQGWVQLFAGVLLVVSCIPFFVPGNFLKTGGHLPQGMGIVFLFLLGVYLWASLHWLREKTSDNGVEEDTGSDGTHVAVILGKIMLGSGLVVTAAHFLIPMVAKVAMVLHIPEGVISATLVALGTSLPELVTSIAAVRKGFGELALGNIIGANILNVLFVAGAAASVTRQGLAAPVHFFTVLFPAMIGTLIIFGMGVYLSGSVFKKTFSIILLTIYALVTLSSYLGAAG
ncbi:K(+)-dependent Na(+)/Ca(++) antiporter protein [Desulforapulum autotrophicum HRM2]|uniref:K(+)-dependent Na(+)/Ca(++) antiporter protein n=1 Tax=Desulforapulum autotrophicum (strain ATCC 43914 / DSM 3382 / VKM B-1955 / HRM2) TaxID=177437 RepID=C0QCV6_DESAH|nr:sodium:calcium antiporter [Desulforapulum autotrophicum]ACN17188.1 K(+)-dependent Na(+)/Ca(++) antiporter protein [Desulforapulum autotrophicum HRM2]